MSDGGEEPTPQPAVVAALLEQLGVDVELDPNDQVVEGLLLLKIVDFGRGTTQLGMYGSAGLDWISKSGLLYAAQQVMDSSTVLESDDGEP